MIFLHSKGPIALKRPPHPNTFVATDTSAFNAFSFNPLIWQTRFTHWGTSHSKEIHLIPVYDLFQKIQGTVPPGKDYRNMYIQLF